MRVSVVINCRYEGLLVAKSIESAIASVTACDFPTDCETIVVADNASEATMNVLTRYGDRVDRLLQTNLSDLGLARNAGAEVAAGELLLFLDGDDLWCRNWVGAAWSEYVGSAKLSILHPQFAIVFGMTSEILVHPDWRDPHFDPRGLAARNYWISSCGVRRDLLLECPFPPADHRRRFGFEDWAWYADTLARGWRHVVVPRTTHFVRRKAVESLQTRTLTWCRVPSVRFSEYLSKDDPARPYDL